MGGSSSSYFQEQELNEFRKLNLNSEQRVEIPTPSEIRAVTDKKGFVIVGFLLAILVPFLIYTLVKSDMRRLDHGSDNCGNLCGVENKQLDWLQCSGKNYTSQPFEIVNILTGERRCTEECPPGYILKDNKCYQKEINIEEIDLWIYSFKLYWKLLIIAGLTTVLCILTLLVFRYFPAVIVWGVVFFSLVLSVAVTAIFWTLFTHSDDKNKGAFCSLALIMTVFTFVVFIVLLVFAKRIKLIIELFKETTKALFDMPVMMITPILTLVCQLIVLALLVVTTTYMMTGAELIQDEENQNFYVYKRNGFMVFAMVFNVFVTIWSLQFFTGCQYMVLSGSVAQWFFKRNPASPIIISFVNTVRFHLGTVAFGSFLIVLVALIKAFIKSLLSNYRLRCLFECCCGNIEQLVKLFSKNSYVETAIYGQSFFRSGKRAVSLLFDNLGNAIAINYVGDFVLAMTEFIILVISTSIAYAIFSVDDYPAFPTILSFFLNLVIVVVVFNVFEIIVDTLFVCFCEDMKINDGQSKPYFMSKDLMQFIDKTKKLYNKK